MSCTMTVSPAPLSSMGTETCVTVTSVRESHSAASAKCCEESAWTIGDLSVDCSARCRGDSVTMKSSQVGPAPEVRVFRRFCVCLFVYLFVSWLLNVVLCLLLSVPVDWLVAWLPSQQHASVSQGRICSDNYTCCHTETEVAD